MKFPYLDLGHHSPWCLRQEEGQVNVCGAIPLRFAFLRDSEGSREDPGPMRNVEPDRPRAKGKVSYERNEKNEQRTLFVWQIVGERQLRRLRFGPTHTQAFLPTTLAHVSRVHSVRQRH